MSKTPGESYTVGVEVTMTPKLLRVWNAHLEKVGERNRSAWARQAILARIREEEAMLEEP